MHETRLFSRDEDFRTNFQCSGVTICDLKNSGIIFLRSGVEE